MTTFKINRVYTRSGDDGSTGLVGGARVSKTSPQVECYGDIDELNSVLGLAKAGLPPSLAELHPVIEYLQQELFDLGAELATKVGDEYPGMWRAEEPHITVLERLCDKYGEHLPELTSFILPGGTLSAAHLHVARTVARRAERTIIRYRDELRKESLDLNAQILKYVNRLSDLLFVLARWSLQAEGAAVPVWQPERERKLP